MVMRSPPWVWTLGSATPVAFTRFSMMVRVWARMSGVMAFASVARSRYSARRPPTRSSPRLGQTDGQPAAVALGLGIALATRAATNTTTIRRGRTQRIGRDSSRSAAVTRRTRQGAVGDAWDALADGVGTGHGSRSGHTAM